MRTFLLTLALAVLLPVLAPAQTRSIVTPNGRGTNNTFVNATLTVPVITDFTGATHNHQGGSGGGSLGAAAIASGVFPIGRLATGIPTGLKFIRDDGTLQVPVAGSPVGSDGSLQYNDSGSFGGTAEVLYDDLAGVLQINHLNVPYTTTHEVTNVVGDANFVLQGAPVLETTNTSSQTITLTTPIGTKNSSWIINLMGNASSTFTISPPGGFTLNPRWGSATWVGGSGTNIPRSGLTQFFLEQRNATVIDVDTIAPLVASDLPATAVTPGAYTSANITVDAQGRITAASSGSAASDNWTAVGSTNSTLAGNAALNGLTVTNGATFSSTVDVSGALTGGGTNVWGSLAGKEAALGFTPVNKAGDTMTGTLLVTGLTNSALTASRVMVSGADKSEASSSVTSTTLAFLDATSSVQTQLNAKQASFTTGLGVTNVANVLSNNIAAGSNVTITAGSSGQLTLASTTSANQSLSSVGFTVDGGGSAISTGKVKGFFTCPYAATISGWNIVADTGTVTVKVWKIATGTAKPTSANSINTSGVALSTGTAIHSTTLTDFTSTTVTANDIFAFNIEAVSGVTEMTFNLQLTKTN